MVHRENYSRKYYFQHRIAKNNHQWLQKFPISQNLGQKMVGCILAKQNSGA
jgi:hypothetical protein